MCYVTEIVKQRETAVFMHKSLFVQKKTRKEQRRQANRRRRNGGNLARTFCGHMRLPLSQLGKRPSKKKKKEGEGSNRSMWSASPAASTFSSFSALQMTTSPRDTNSMLTMAVPSSCHHLQSSNGGENQAAFWHFA